MKVGDDDDADDGDADGGGEETAVMHHFGLLSMRIRDDAAEEESLATVSSKDNPQVKGQDE